MEGTASSHVAALVPLPRLHMWLHTYPHSAYTRGLTHTHTAPPRAGAHVPNRAFHACLRPNCIEGGSGAEEAGGACEQVKPKGDLVLAKVAEAEEATAGGILLPTQAQRKPTSGTLPPFPPSPSLSRTTWEPA